MAGIGRPKGSRKVSPERLLAMQLFTAWRAAGYNMTVHIDTAFNLTQGMVDLSSYTENDKISLAALALKYAIAQRKAK